MRRALIIVDVQNDFLPDGKLAVPHGDNVIPVINQILKDKKFDMIIASQDWHPADHTSFKNPQINPDGWPAHCIQDTKGAELSEKLDIWDHEFLSVFKGEDKEKHPYSAFALEVKDGKIISSNDLGDTLLNEGIDEVYICGLAADYCVLETAKDADRLGLKAFMIMDATAPVHIPLMDILFVLQNTKIKPIYSNEI